MEATMISLEYFEYLDTAYDIPGGLPTLKTTHYQTHAHIDLIIHRYLAH